MISSKAIVFVGAGNLATSLSLALKRAGHTILQVYSRTEESAKCLADLLETAYCTDMARIRDDADVYVYALSDSCYPLQAVAGGRGLHLLTSGSVPYYNIRSAGRVGVLYPFQTFTKSKPVLDFSCIPIMVEGSTKEALEQTEQLARTVSAEVYVASAEARQRLHLAGVLANNFSNCMYALAEQQLQLAGLPFSVLLPLIDETAQKVHTLAPQQAQTGPAVRGDVAVIERQLSLIDNQELKNLYSLITDIIRKV